MHGSSATRCYIDHLVTVSDWTLLRVKVLHFVLSLVTNCYYFMSDRFKMVFDSFRHCFSEVILNFVPHENVTLLGSHRWWKVIIFVACRYLFLADKTTSDLCHLRLDRYLTLLAEFCFSNFWYLVITSDTMLRCFSAGSCLFSLFVTNSLLTSLLTYICYKMLHWSLVVTIIVTTDTGNATLFNLFLLFLILKVILKLQNN